MEPMYEPDEKEASAYYYGLPSCPRLVARSSGQPWRNRLPGSTFPRLKTLGIVGKHPIRDAWDAKLQAEVIEALGTTRWTSIDVLRIGYTGMGESKVPHPVVLWIGVRRRSLTWDDGITIIEACVAILRRHNLIDVQCEIRESEVHASGEPSTRYLSSESLSPARAASHFLFTASPGQSINAVGSSAQGSLGLYLQPGDNNPYPESVWAVTCRHVVCRDQDENENYEHRHNGQPRIDILLPSDKAIEELTKESNLHLRMRSEALKNAEKDLARDTLEQQRQPDEERVQEKRFRFRESHDFVNKTLPKWQSTTDRILGYVRFAPPLQTAPPMNPLLDEFGPRRDWALIEVDKDKHSGPVANTVDVVTGLTLRSDIYVSMLGRHWETYSYDRSENPSFEDELINGKLLRLGRVVPIDELRTPKMLDPLEDPCLIVGKRGGATDMTWGYLNGLKSCLWDEDNTKSMEFCVVSSNHKMAFSERGDSGSVVFDATGRIVGIIVGGAKGPLGRESLDITYVTSMVWLQKDMKDHGYSVKIA